MLTRIIEFTGVFIIVAFCSISIFFALLARDLHDSEFIENFTSYTSFFEDRFFDARMRRGLTLDGSEIDKRLVLAAIDDDSLDQIGRWPWTRTVWADFMDKMTEYNAKVIAFDVFFSEPELARIEGGRSPDDYLAESIATFQSLPNRHVILPYSLVNYRSLGFDEIPMELYFDSISVRAPDEHLRQRWISPSTFPVEVLLFAEPMLGFISSRADPDGIFRHYPLITQSESNYFPSYSLKAYEAFTGNVAEVTIIPGGEAELKVPEGTVNLNYDGETKIRWFGGEFNFPVVGISDILAAEPGSQEDKKLREIFEDQLVFVGSTAFAAYDLRHTPIDAMLPGVFYHMNLTKMLLDGDFFVPSSVSAKYTWLILGITTLLMISIMMLRNPLLDIFTVIAIVIAAIYIDVNFLLPSGHEIKLFFGLLSPIACYSWITMFNFYLTNKEKKEIRGTFSRYVAPAIVDQMLSNPDMVKIGGERKNITVFFSDIRDFTNISEKLSPEELSICLNQYMGVMTDILFENKGTLDKYIGDMIVAYWGAPVEIENHAYWGVKTAVAMMEALPAVNEGFREQGFPEFKHGMGLNTGDCSVGNMGSDKIFSYTALGDSMNLGARAESLCKYYGVEINITEFTKNAIPEDLQKEFKFRILDKVRVKGKEEPVTLWEVLYPSHRLWNEEDSIEIYNKSFYMYLDKNFAEAVKILKPLHEKFPEDKCFKRMLDTCNDFLEVSPPPNWDGVYTHKSK